MPEDSPPDNTSNVNDLSLRLLLGGVTLLAIATRLRLVLAAPLWVAGALAAAGGASMRPTLTRIAEGIAGEEQLWVRLKSSVSVMHPTKAIYEYWRDPLNWPKFMPDIDVEKVGTDRFELTKRVASGLEVRQQILITEDQPYHHIAWVSLGEELPHRGSVEFTTNGGTYVTLVWEYKVAFGAAFNAISKPALRRLNEVLLTKLQRFKQIMEQGGATTCGPTGYKCAAADLLWHVIKSDADRAFADLREPASSDA